MIFFHWCVCVLAVLVLVGCSEVANASTSHPIQHAHMHNITVETHDHFDMNITVKVMKILHRFYNGTTVELSSIVQLSKPSRRNLLCRIRFRTPLLAKKERSLILKQTTKTKTSAETWARLARDWTGLEFFNKIMMLRGHIPTFFGGSKRFKFILMEDLGEAPVTLASYLTNSTFADEEMASDAVRHTMKLLGRMHGLARRGVDLFQEMLHDLDSRIPPWNVLFENQHRKMRRYINTTSTLLDIPHPPELYTEVRLMVNRTLAPGPFTTVIHSDLCPDNVIFSPTTRRANVFDFEWSEVGSAFLDMTQLRMGMPGCWCAGTLPAALLDSAEDDYRAELAHTVAAARDDHLFYDAYMDAVGYRAMKALEIVKSLLKHDLSSAELTEEHKARIGKSTQIAISRLELFEAANERHQRLPHVSNLVGITLQRLRHRWGAVATKQVQRFAVFENATETSRHPADAFDTAD